MENDRRLRRLRGGTYVVVAVLGVTSAATAATKLAQEPGFAALASAITCASSSSACVSGTNPSSGPGVTGSSSTGYGVVGVGKNGFGVRAVSTSNYGLLGTSATGAAGVAGTTAARYGVYGYTTGGSGVGTGVYGSSVSGYGVYGRTTSGDGIGVIGYETGSGIGTYGYSSSGYGQEAITANGYGLYAAAGSGTGVYVSSTTGYGVVANTHGSIGVLATNSAGNGGDFRGSYIGLLGRAPASGGYPLVLTDSNGNNVFYVDGAGNVSYSGSLYTFMPTANGARVKSFSPKTTLPTVEDTGTAQLVGGAAQVRLDPTFAASIDASSGYRVFVTPGGDTRGLYVAMKSATNFVVREAQAGHANVSFDYRVVATALGRARERMAPLVGEAQPRAAAPVAPKMPAVSPALPRLP